MVSLDALLEHLGVDVTGWTFEEVQAISGDGTVLAGNGYKNGVQSGFVITGMTYPNTPRSLSDFNWDGFVDFTDFDLFIRSFEMGSLSADANHDGFLDFTDFDAFVSAFDAGV